MRKWMDMFIVSPRDKTIEPRPKLPLKLDVLWLWELFEIATRWSSFAMALSHMNSESSQQVSSHICCVWSSDIDTSVEREKRCQYVSGLLRFPSAAQYMRWDHSAVWNWDWWVCSKGGMWFTTKMLRYVSQGIWCCDINCSAWFKWAWSLVKSPLRPLYGYDTSPGSWEQVRWLRVLDYPDESTIVVSTVFKYDASFLWQEVRVLSQKF